MATGSVLRRAAGQAAELGTQLWRSTVPTAPTSQSASAWVFLGPPGVGKGTYSTRVAEALGIPHISAGDLVRDEIKSGSSFGQTVRDTAMKKGWFPDLPGSRCHDCMQHRKQ